MEAISTLFLIVFLTFALLFGAARVKAEKPTKPQEAKGVFSRLRGWFVDSAYSETTDKGSGPLTKDELKERLSRLASSEKPKDLAMGAMCYKMAYPSGATDVICTFCQKKTVVKKDWDTTRIDDCLRMVQAINKAKRNLEAKLDNRFYCAHCNPALKENPQRDENGALKLPQRKHLGCKTVNNENIDGLYLIIKFPKEEKSRRVSINHHGLKILTAFIQGKDRTKGMTGTETALKENIDTIKSILGIE